MECPTPTLLENSASSPTEAGHINSSSSTHCDFKSQQPLKWAQWANGVWRALLTQAHLVGLPTSRALWSRAAEALPTHASPKEQGALEALCLLSTVLHPLALQYPRDVTTELLTVLWLRQVFHDRGWASCRVDLCVTTIQDLLQQGYEEQELVYKSYVLDAKKLQECETREWLRDVLTSDRFCGSSPEIMPRNSMEVTHSPGSNNIIALSKRSKVSSAEILPQNIEDNFDKNQNRVNSPLNRTNIRDFLAGVKDDIITAFAADVSRAHGTLIQSNYELSGNCFSFRDGDSFLECRTRENATFVQLTEGGIVDGNTEGRCHVTLLEAGRGITRGTTGLTSWGGGAVMAEWVHNNTQIVRGKRVLELGAGIGYTAACIITRSQPSDCRQEQLMVHQNSASEPICGHQSTEDEAVLSYTATDCHPHVLDLLYHNLSLTDASEPPSYSHLSAHRRQQCQRLSTDELPPGATSAQPWSAPRSSFHVGRVEVKVVQLDWRSVAAVPDCDVVVAADVVYARHLLPHLARLLRLALSRPADVRSAAAYVACTRRDPETIAEFLAALAAENLNYSIVYQATLDAESALFVYNESHVPVKIYKITLDGRELGENEYF